MPRKVRRANLFFLCSGPSGPTLRRAWRKLRIRSDSKPPWNAPGLLAGLAGSPEADALLAIEEGALMPFETLGAVPEGWNLVLFEEGKWDEPAAVVKPPLIEEYRKAAQGEEPLLFADEALFGGFFWKLSAADELLDAEHLRLEFLDAIDAERRRYERLQRKHESGLGPAAAARRERIPEEVRMFVWRRDEGSCVLCGSQANLEFDHLIPLSRGGSNTSRNIQLLCEACNRSKSDSV